MTKELMTGFKDGMKYYGENFSIIINSLLLCASYFLGIGLTSLFAKIIGKHFLDLKIDKKRKSYWTDLNLSKKPLQDYLRQF